MTTNIATLRRGAEPDADPARKAPLLQIENLQVEFDSRAGVVRAVDGASWSIAPGETLALVGESGCGKSVTALAAMRLLGRPAGRITGGRVMFQGENLLELGEAGMRNHRGKSMAMVFQEPMSSLNPLLTIGDQIMEPMLEHLDLSKRAARERALDLLTRVGIPDPDTRIDSYPHELSGGMRQRVMIAIGISCNPKLLIADEPTTALDVTIQAQILELMRSLSRELGIALVLITHNLGIVARYVDRVNIMYAGRIVESGPVEEIFAHPRHPYTIGLLASVPRLDRDRSSRLATIEGSPPDLANPPAGCRFAPRCAFALDICAQDPRLDAVSTGRFVACHRKSENLEHALPRHEAKSDVVRLDAAPVLELRGVRKSFPLSKSRVVHAVNDVSLKVHPGETVGVVGESGCGKTTLGRSILRLTEPTAGDVIFEGSRMADLSGPGLRRVRRRMQVVFQDPSSSLNPRMTIGRILSEPLLVHGFCKTRADARARAISLLDMVGLLPQMAERYPHQISGGQRQRVGIARALSLDPSFMVLDEPVSALDVSIQGQIVNLLEDIQSRLGIGFLFIAHDLAVVRHISHRVVVMYLGRVMETADSDTLYSAPLHPYTRALLDAAPIPDPSIEKRTHRRALEGELPSPLRAPSGCVFRTRCPLADAACAREIPELSEKRPGQSVACIKV